MKTYLSLGLNLVGIFTALFAAYLHPGLDVSGYLFVFAIGLGASILAIILSMCAVTRAERVKMRDTYNYLKYRK
jgi:hypothetical protein